MQVMKDLHSVMQPPSHPRSDHDLSHLYSTTFSAGKLIPWLALKCYPNDTVRMKAQPFIRMLAPLKQPNIDNMYIDMFFFKVHFTLLWEHTKQFFGERDTLAEILTPTEYLIPVLGTDIGEPGTPDIVPYKDVTAESIYNYFRLPVTDGYGIELDGLKNISALPFRAYNLIWNEWFRNQSLQEKVTFVTDDGPDITDYTLLPRNKRRDYFNAALPWQQKGEEVLLPLGDSCPVVGNGSTMAFRDGSEPIILTNNLSDAPKFKDYSGAIIPQGTDVSGYADYDVHFKSLGVTENPLASGLIADLSEATGANMSDFRYAQQLQKYLEMEARGGSRYIEKNYIFFGQQSSDQLLYRPEFLGGGTQRLSINTVVQSGANSDNPEDIGRVTSFVTGFAESSFQTHCEQHCYIIGMFSVRHDQTYSQGIERHWTEREPLDHMWPIFSGLSEQEIMRRELFALGGDDDDEEVFGFGPRYQHLREVLNARTGLLGAGLTGGLNEWTMEQNQVETVALNSDFIEGKDDVEIYRACTVQSGSQFIIDIKADCKAARCIPTYGIPGKDYL